MNDYVRREGRLFLDGHGRQVILRGVNLGGDCKVPYPDGGTHFPSDFADHRDVSFVGRPFPLDEADAHFSRLKRWGFNILRVLTTWEAVEHAGPGLYDDDYLDYLQQICERAGHYGFNLFIDFHQDVWSRMTGGSGAPGWCFDAVGLDYTRFHAADCVHVMQHKFDYANPSGRQEAYPQMTWGSNYRLPAVAFMWNLFWGGRYLTPDFKIGDENVQDYLQGHYLGSMEQIARRIAHMPHVIGFDTLNEPGTGYLGEPMQYRHMDPSEHNLAYARGGACLSPADALAVARGIPTTVPVLERKGIVMEVVGERLLNANRVSIWKDGASCPFEQAGAYRMKDGGVQILREDYFKAPAGFRFDLSDHAYGPLAHRVARTIRGYNPDWAVFAEMDPYGVSGGRRFAKSMPENCVNASHWYDRETLMFKTFDRDGRIAAEPAQRQVVLDRFVTELSSRKAMAEDLPGGAPTLIGEFGIPFDLDDGEAYDRWQNGEHGGAVWRKHDAALALMYSAMDKLHLHSTQWNYTASNRNDLRIGDGWNQEDLSIYSDDQLDADDAYSAGARGILGFCRPFAQAVQGRLETVEFRTAGEFELAYMADPAIGAPTRLFIPSIQFPDGFDVAIDGAAEMLVAADDPQCVEIAALGYGRIRVVITPKRASNEAARLSESRGVSN